LCLNYLNNTKLSYYGWIGLINFIQSYVSDDIETSKLYYRLLFHYYPFATERAFSGVYNFIKFLIKAGQKRTVYSIIRQCPQLELGLLFPDKHCYSNLPEWIDTIEDEEQKAQIKLWTIQVQKGKMTESEFEKNVNNL